MKEYVLGLGIAILAACGDPSASTTSGGAPQCTPGDQIACACSGGVMGVQACASDGSHYEACTCAGSTSGGGGGGGVGGGFTTSSATSSTTSSSTVTTSTSSSSTTSTGGGECAGQADGIKCSIGLCDNQVCVMYIDVTCNTPQGKFTGCNGGIHANEIYFFDPSTNQWVNCNSPGLSNPDTTVAYCPPGTSCSVTVTNDPNGKVYYGTCL